MNNQSKNSGLKDISILLTVLVFATALSYVFTYLQFQEATIIIIYMLAVVIISQSTTHYIYGFIASLISVLAFNFFFTHPLYTFNISQPDYLFTFFVMFVASFLSSSLTSKLKREKHLSQEKTNQVVLVEAINHNFQTFDIEKALNVAAKLIADNCLCNVTILIHLAQREFSAKYTQLTSNAYTQQYQREIILNTQEIGTLSVEYTNTISKKWINSIGDLLSQNIEKKDLVDKQTQAQFEIREQKLRNDLLGAISHDLRTPLSTILGSSDTLLENLDKLNDSDKQELLRNIREDSLWLINSVENILSFMRVEEGFKLNVKMGSVEELFGDVTARMVSRVSQQLVLDLPSEPIYYTMDIYLMEKVLLNLVDNASKYSPPTSKITLKAYLNVQSLIFEVLDEGDGIPDSEKKTVFERFYTYKSQSIVKRKGLGLGLAICKTIVEAHHGRLIVKDNLPNGCIFHCAFPYPGGQDEQDTDH